MVINLEVSYHHAITTTHLPNVLALKNGHHLLPTTLAFLFNEPKETG
jgi:hypothetical protein